MDPSRALRRAFLERLRRSGYRSAFRRNGWTEVLVSKADERWFGAGADRAAALDDALANMFPSAAARAALIEAFGAEFEPKTPSATARASIPEALRADGTATTSMTSSSSPRESVAARVPAPPSASAMESSPTPFPASSPAPANESTSGPRPTPPPASTTAWAAKRPVEALLDIEDELAELEETVHAYFEDALDYAPDRQRLLVLAWIARARALDVRATGRGRVSERVARLAHLLGQLTKLGWPGSVRALGLHMRPSDCLDDLADKGPIAGWAELAERAEAELATREEADPAHGRDEWGWGDAEVLAPRPADPSTLLAEARAKLEAWTGPIASARAVLAGKAFLQEPDAERLRSNAGDFGREATAVAKTLRWLRALELEGWGECIGRLRWSVDRGGEDARGALRELLDPLVVFRQSWARANGRDPEAREKKRRKSELLVRSRALAAGDTAALVEWLGAAFELGNELPVAKIAEALAFHADAVLALTHKYEKRSLRGRLRDLQACMRGPIEAPVPGTPEPLDDETAVEVEPERPPSVPPSVLEFTRGKRALFVCNRADPEHDEELRRAFEFERVERSEHGPRRLESAAERIRAGRFDVVLAATGFLPHKADSVLRTACKQSSVRMVRVDKGRVSACARHLARELGV
ncbi:MAG: hypothetical protein HZA53_12105 [Planctomycetes bacterium]|nr:hypothetical protein [Planctomycetota bacterium]